MQKGSIPHDRRVLQNFLLITAQISSSDIIHMLSKMLASTNESKYTIALVIFSLISRFLRRLSDMVYRLYIAFLELLLKLFRLSEIRESIP